MKIKFNWNKPEKQILESSTGGDRTLLFMANEAKRLMEPYVPYLNGPLSTKVSAGVDSGGGYVHYKQPYAGFQYYGVVMIGKKSNSPYAGYNEGKKTTAQKLNYNKSKHPLATSQWDKAMKAAHMGYLTRAVQDYVKKGGGV